MAHEIDQDSFLADLIAYEGDDKHERFRSAADALRQRMEAQAAQVRDLILAQPPVRLLGHVWSTFHIAMIGDQEDSEDNLQTNPDVIKTFQFALEYLHAVWSCHSDLPQETEPLDNVKADELFDALEELHRTTAEFNMISTLASLAEADNNDLSGKTQGQARSSWVLIRGNRYQVLEEEFFQFVLGPHSEALQSAYKMDSAQIASSIQQIADSIRMGFAGALDSISQASEMCFGMVEAGQAADIESAIMLLQDSDREVAYGALKDIFLGGVCNLSRHTDLTPSLLEDLSYIPGANDEFFGPGDFSGTPLRTLPARIKPGIKLGEDYYVTDGQFVRDSAYRAIQRGLLSRLPDYRELWNSRQKSLIEEALPHILAAQFEGARIYREVYYRDPTTYQWVETDLVAAIDDVLVVVEAKAGVMAMHSPETNFENHRRAIQELIIKAYKQCRRFLEYLTTSHHAHLYSLHDGNYVENGRLRLSDFRLIVPIGLTVESFTPFSAMCKEFQEVSPILDRHPFVSMAVDDLFVINRFLPTGGEFFHYLQVRQAIAGIPHAFIFDEIDHLGAYIEHNRFDAMVSDELKEADSVGLDGFSEIVDRHFGQEHWADLPPPSQHFPDGLMPLLQALDTFRPPGWLRINAAIRNFSDQGRANLASFIEQLTPTLEEFPTRRFLMAGDGDSLQTWLCREGEEPDSEQLRREGQVACLVANMPKTNVFVVSFDSSFNIQDISCHLISKPSAVQTNFPDLLRVAEEQRGRSLDLHRSAKANNTQKKVNQPKNRHRNRRKKGKRRRR